MAKNKKLKKSVHENVDSPEIEQEFEADVNGVEGEEVEQVEKEEVVPESDSPSEEISEDVKAEDNEVKDQPSQNIPGKYRKFL